MANLPNPEDYRSPRAWRHYGLTMFFVGVFVGAFIGALIADWLVLP